LLLLEELEADNTPFEQCEDVYIMVNRLASKYLELVE